MRPMRGMSLIDVVVGSALFLIIFVGLFGILRASLEVAGLARAKAAATALANSQMEYLRSLSYASIGTQGGIPSGSIPQTATTTMSGLSFSVRTYVAYVDDPKDGLGGADHNAVTTDYKTIKVTVSYSVQNVEREVVLVSNAAPPGIETTTGGGTLRVDVVDAQGAPVPGASVRIRNASTSPTIDLTTFSDAYGVVLLGGAPTSTQYRIDVAKAGYSSAQTYARDAVNQNPTPGYLTVAQGQTTTGTFAIDALTSLTLRTFSPIEDRMNRDTFDSSAGIVSSSNTTVSGSALTVSGAPGAYAVSGSARSTTTAPAYLASWSSASGTIAAPVGTSARFHVADSSGTLLSDAVIPGNSTGFTTTVDLSGISTTTYPALTLVASLTSDGMSAPTIADWSLGYSAGPLPLPNIPFTLTGGKTVGSTALGAAIYKTTVATTTNASGVRTLSLEWDAYALTLSGYTISVEEPSAPYELLPATSVDATLILTP